MSSALAYAGWSRDWHPRLWPMLGGLGGRVLGSDPHRVAWGAVSLALAHAGWSLGSQAHLGLSSPAVSPQLCTS